MRTTQRCDLVSAACADAGLDAASSTRPAAAPTPTCFAAMGVDTLALACGMSGVHSTDEQLAVADMEALAALVLAVARRMAAGDAR